MMQILLLDELKMRSDNFQPLIAKSFPNSLIRTSNTNAQFIPLISQFSGNILMYFTSDIRENSKLVLEAVGKNSLGNRTIVVTNKVSKWLVSHLKTFGIHGYVVMESNGDQILIDAIHHINRGEAYFCPKVCQAIAGTLSDISVESLSEREKQIVTLISGDHSSKQIADKLCISLHTVSSHRKSILKKLNVKTAGGLIRRISDSDLMS